MGPIRGASIIEIIFLIASEKEKKFDQKTFSEASIECRRKKKIPQKNKTQQNVQKLDPCLFGYVIIEKQNIERVYKKKYILPMLDNNHSSMTNIVEVGIKSSKEPLELKTIISTNYDFSFRSAGNSC